MRVCDEKEREKRERRMSDEERGEDGLKEVKGVRSVSSQGLKKEEERKK